MRKNKVTELKPRRILVRSTNWIGDAIMTTPAVRSIRENFPDAEITLLALPWVADVFAASPHVDRIIPYHKNGEHQGLKGRIKLIRQVASLRFDLAILLQNAFEAALVSALARIPARAGYATDGRRLLLTHPVRLRKEVKKIHQVHYYQGMLRELGLQCGPDELFLRIPAETGNKAREIVEGLRDEAGGQPCIVGLNPGASYGPAKRWPAERFGVLAGRIEREMGCRLLVFGTGADRDAARTIARYAPGKVVDLTGRTSLAEAMALIEKCHVFVTNDSGLMHVAAALKTPTVAIFGSTNPVTTGPYSQNSLVIRKAISCSPCMKTHCSSDFRCMREITSDEVFAAVRKLLPADRN